MELFLEDCLDILPGVQDKSIDMILTDLPHGATRNGWGCVIDLKRLWEYYNRIVKNNEYIASQAQSPFDKVFAYSNLKMYGYEWIIERTGGTGHLNAAKMPMKCHENVLTFYKHLPTYSPQITTGHSPVHNYIKCVSGGSNHGKTRADTSGGGSTERYPRDVLWLKWNAQREGLHPTQKPLEACKYFIRICIDFGDMVLGSYMGSNTTGVICQELGRKYIGIEKDTVSYRIVPDRIDQDLRRETTIWKK